MLAASDQDEFPWSFVSFPESSSRTFLPESLPNLSLSLSLSLPLSLSLSLSDEKFLAYFHQTALLGNISKLYHLKVGW